ncbi:hypothetical protein ACT7C1_33085 [Bacillus paranthracis]
MIYIKKHEITTQKTVNLKRKGKEKEMTNFKEDIPTDLQYPHSTEPAQTQTPAPTTIPMQEVPVIPESEPTTIPLEPIEQVESSIPESFHIHYAGLRSKQKGHSPIASPCYFVRRRITRAIPVLDSN